MLASERAGRICFASSARCIRTSTWSAHARSTPVCEQTRVRTEPACSTYLPCVRHRPAPALADSATGRRAPARLSRHPPSSAPQLACAKRQTGPLTSRCKLMRRSRTHEYCWGQAAEKGRPQPLARARLWRVARRHPSAHASRAECHLFLQCCPWHARRHVLAAAGSGRPGRLRPDRSFAQAQARNPRASGQPPHPQGAAPDTSRPRRLRWPTAPTWRSPLPLPWPRALCRTRTGEAGRGWVEGGRHGRRRQ